MTPQEAKKMLKAKLKCFIAETSGTNHDCNMRLCDGCSLNYEQGNMGEQKEALDMAIQALEQQRNITNEELYQGFIELEAENERLHDVLEQQRWHLASEEPPKEDTDYIITYQWKGSWSGDIYTEVCVSGYHGDGLWDLGNHKVLAWRELPQPYKAESEGLYGNI